MHTTQQPGQEPCQDALQVFLHLAGRSAELDSKRAKGNTCWKAKNIDVREKGSNDNKNGSLNLQPVKNFSE